MAAGCVTTPEQADNASIGSLCYTYAVAVAGNASPEAGGVALTELQQRGYLSAAEVQSLVTGPIRPGMTEKAALCAWGNSYERVNTTQTAGGLTKQYVDGTAIGSPSYLYTRNGVVTGIQTSQ